MEAFKAKKINQFDCSKSLKKSEKIFISNKTKVFFNYLIKLIFNKKNFRKIIYQIILREFFKSNNLFLLLKIILMTILSK